MMNFGVKVLIATLGLAIPFAPVQAKADAKPMNKVEFASKVGCEDLKLSKVYNHKGLNNQCAEEFLDTYLNNILGNFHMNKKPSYDCGNNTEDHNNGNQNGGKEEPDNGVDNGGNQGNNNGGQEKPNNDSENGGQEKPENDLGNNGNQENNENQENNNENNNNGSNGDINNGGNNSNGENQENNGSTENGQVESSFSEFQNKVLELVNQERAKAGVKPLKGNLELSNVATIKSQDMIDKNYFDHNSPTYGSPFDMMKKFGISFNMAGENIAYGQRTPEEVMKGWMNSPGHRKNILNPNFEQIGIGIAKNSSGVTYWTQMFIK